MNTLDRNKMKILIESLQLADKVGFESLSSPVVPLLEAGTDVCLLLASAYDAGAKLQHRTNPEIRFLDSSDSLGNPKQITLWKKDQFVWAPQLSSFFRKLASLFVWIKANSPKIIDIISKIKEIIGLEEPPVKFPVPIKKIKAEESPRKKRNRDFYYRRQRKKRSF